MTRKKNNRSNIGQLTDDAKKAIEAAPDGDMIPASEETASAIMDLPAAAINGEPIFNAKDEERNASHAARIRDLLELNDGYEPGKKPYVELGFSHRLGKDGSSAFVVLVSAEWNNWATKKFESISLIDALGMACEEKARRKCAAR